MFPTPSQSLKTVVLVVVLGYLVALDSSEARGLDEQQDELMNYQRSIQQAQQQQQQQQPGLGGEVSNLERLDDSDDDDEDEDRLIQQQLQPQLQQQYQQSAMSAPVQVAGSDLYQTDQTASAYQPPLQGAGSASDDLRAAASKHHGHHKHGAKGWLDMGAWTGKKGAFGWYDKHPVGKGR